MQLKSIMRLATAAVLLLGAAGYGQSLGDIARQNREAKGKGNIDAASTTQPKVITNKDLATDATTGEAPFGPSPVASVTKSPATSEQTGGSQRAAEVRAQQHNDQQRIAQERAAEQWKRQILAQKHKLVTLQARVDQLRASIQAENGTTQYEGPNGRSQARQLQRVAEIQLQVDEQRRALVDMQEAARHAGMHTVVYDP
jgi:hypothetical protein